MMNRKIQQYKQNEKDKDKKQDIKDDRKESKESEIKDQDVYHLSIMKNSNILPNLEQLSLECDADTDGSRSVHYFAFFATNCNNFVFRVIPQ